MTAPAYLVAGADETLAHREASRILEELRAEASDLDVEDLRAEDIREHGLPDLRTASLFGGARAVLVRDAHELPSELTHALAAELEGTPPDATLVLVARSTQRIQRLAKAVAAVGERIDVKPPADYDEKSWRALVADELRRHGRSASPAAVEALLDAAGRDVGTIAEKVGQVVARVTTGEITEEHVAEVTVGRGSHGAFAVADAMCDRDPATALARLRGVLESGVEPVLVLGALSYRVRAVVAVAAGVDADVGLRMSPGLRNRHHGLRRNFGPGELTRAYEVLAEADYALKTGGGEPEAILERAVVDIATPSPA